MESGDEEHAEAGDAGHRVDAAAGELHRLLASCRREPGEFGCEEPVGEHRDEKAGSDRTHGHEILLPALVPEADAGSARGRANARQTSRPVASRPVRTIVVLPTYNEAENIDAFARRLRTELPDLDLLVVDDNSPDGTGAIADALAAELGSIKVLHRSDKSGLGSAYREGFRVALDEQAEVIVSMDADFSHDIAAIPSLLSAVEAGADMVIGSRYVPGGNVRDWPFHRRLLSKWGNRYTAWALEVPVTDCTSGFRAYRGEAMARIDVGATTAEGYAFLTELVRRMTDVGARIDEVPIEFVDRRYGTSKMSWRIVVESMKLVTEWGVRERVTRRRG
jgi:dolichol-phosphate mannosyltransferase